MHTHPPTALLSHIPRWCTHTLAFHQTHCTPPAKHPSASSHSTHTHNLSHPPAHTCHTPVKPSTCEALEPPRSPPPQTSPWHPTLGTPSPSPLHPSEPKPFSVTHAPSSVHTHTPPAQATSCSVPWLARSHLHTHTHNPWCQPHQLTGTQEASCPPVCPTPCPHHATATLTMPLPCPPRVPSAPTTVPSLCPPLCHYHARLVPPPVSPSLPLLRPRCAHPGCSRLGHPEAAPPMPWWHHRARDMGDSGGDG